MRTRLLIALFVFVLPAVALSCQVPVFRFALERWVPDAYRVSVSPGRSGEFTPEEKTLIELLKSWQSGSDGESRILANLHIEVTDTGKESDQASFEVSYPEKARGFSTKPIWEGPLTEENVKGLVDSPVRREIVKLILEGQSAVWVLVESGNREEDQSAAGTVLSSAAEARDTLRISPGVMTRSQAESKENFAAVNADDILQSEVPLKIDYSLVRIRRDDPSESLFLSMLLSIEDDLEQYAGEPMVFPVFGRGRLLEPLIGRGIRTENLLDYASYICGACSCEVKDKNPGVDLLITADWDSALHGSEVIMDKILPPLEGTAVFASAPLEAEDVQGDVSSGLVKSDVAVGPPSTLGLPLTAILITAGTVVAVIVLGTLFVLRRPS